MRRIAKEEYFRYFPVGQREEQWGLYVTSVGRIVRRFPGTPDRGHPPPYYYVWEKGRVLDEFGALYITQGEGEFESAATDRTVVAAGTVVLLFPGVWHRYRPCENSCWSYYWIHFGGGYAAHLMQQKLIVPEEPIHKIGLNDALLRTYLSLLERARSEPPGFQQMMSGCILEIFGITLALSHGQQLLGHPTALVRQAKAILEQRVESEVGMDKLALSLGTSYDHFRHIFKQHTGLAPHQYLVQLRINRAKELLAGTDLTAKKIAAVLCFEDSYYFSKAFKKKTGKSPSQWRKTIQKNEKPARQHKARRKMDRP